MKKCFNIHDMINFICMNLFIVLTNATMVSLYIVDMKYMPSWFTITTLVVFLIGWSAIWLCMAASTLKRNLKKQ